MISPRPQGAIGLLLVAALVALAPLAHASPPDQTWIGGFYDDADYDDIVLIITSAVGLVDAPPRVSGRPMVIAVASAQPFDESGSPSPDVLSGPSRAPPLA